MEMFYYYRYNKNTILNYILLMAYIPFKNNSKKISTQNASNYET